MRFRFFAFGGRKVASSRVRVFWVADALRELGHETTVTVVSEYSFRALGRYLRELLAARRDVVYLQRTIYNKYFLVAILIARMLGVRFYFDFDDPVFVHSPKKTAILSRLSIATICGSAFIEEWAKKHSARTLVLEDGIPLCVYTVREYRDETPCIGWIGNGPAHYENLLILPNIFKRLKQAGIDFHFRLVGALGDARIHALFNEFNPEIIDSLDWADPSNAVREIHSFSIGIMPLIETPWGKAKYFKLLEYMACGVPVVASATDTVSRIIHEGCAGAIARDEDEWVLELTRLLRNPEMRKTEGKKGRQLIEKRYSTELIAQELVDDINSWLA